MKIFNYEILLFVTTWMDLEVIMLSKISQKDKYCMILHMLGVKKKNQPSWNRDQICGCQGWGN